jgi:hypothetical protein
MSDAQSNSSAVPRTRVWIQFRLRTLLTLVTLVAAALWAFRVYVEPYRQQRRSLEVIKELGGRVVTAEAAPWQRRLLGADLQNITLIDVADCHEVDKYLPHVASLPCLKTLVVGGEEFTDGHLRRLRLPKLTGLVLDSTAVTDATLAAWQEENPTTDVYQSDRQLIASLPTDDFSIIGTRKRAERLPKIQALVGAEYFVEVHQICVRLPDKSCPPRRSKKCGTCKPSALMADFQLGPRSWRGCTI